MKIKIEAHWDSKKKRIMERVIRNIAKTKPRSHAHDSLDYFVFRVLDFKKAPE